MNTLTAGFALVAVVGFAGLCRTRHYWTAGCFAVALTVAYLTLANVMGLPKPLWLDWRYWFASPAEAEVVAHLLDEPEAIYLWLLLPDESEPRSYVMPWDTNKARQLRQAVQEGQEKGTGVRMARPFERDAQEAERRFYAPPVEALPPKP